MGLYRGLQGKPSVKAFCNPLLEQECFATSHRNYEVIINADAFLQPCFQKCWNARVSEKRIQGFASILNLHLIENYRDNKCKNPSWL